MEDALSGSRALESRTTATADREDSMRTQSRAATAAGALLVVLGAVPACGPITRSRRNSMRPSRSS